MKLYGYFRSSAAFRVRIALNLKGLDYDSAFIHLRRGDQRNPDFSASIRRASCRRWKTDGQILIQSLPIIEYLDETHPEPPLLPPDAAGRARVRALAAIVACDIHPINNLRVLRYLQRPLGHDHAAIETWYNHWIAEGFGALERLLAEDAPDRPVLPRRPARPGRYRAGAAGGQCRAISPRPQALSDHSQDFRDVHDARRFCRGAPGAPARPRSMIAHFARADPLGRLAQPLAGALLLYARPPAVAAAGADSTSSAAGERAVAERDAPGREKLRRAGRPPSGWSTAPSRAC